MSRPTNLELLPPWANVIDASPPVAFSVEVEVPGPSVYVIPADEMPTFPTQRIPGEIDFWAQVDFTVRQKIRAPQDVTLGGEVILEVDSIVRLPAVQFGFDVTFSVVSSFRYVRAVQFSGAAALEAASVVQLPAAFTGSSELAVESAVNLPALFGGEVTLSIEAQGGFQLADVDFAGEVTFSVESRVRFVRTVDFSASVALAAAAFERFVRAVDFAGDAALAVSQFPKAPLGVGFGGSAALSISAPIPVIPREIGFSGAVTLSVVALRPVVVEASMDRSLQADQVLAASRTWEQINGWHAVIAGTTIVGNGIVVSGSGNAKIEIGSQWDQNLNSTMDWRLLVNGTVVWTKGTASNTIFVNVIPSLGLSDGDVLTAQGWGSSEFPARRTVKGTANTYLRVIPI